MTKREVLEEKVAIREDQWQRAVGLESQGHMALVDLQELRIKYLDALLDLMEEDE